MHVKEAITTRLTVREQDMNALVMIAAYSLSQLLPCQIACATRGIAKAHPGNAWKGSLWVSLYAKYRFLDQSRRRCGYYWRCWLSHKTYLILTPGKDYTTNQHSSNNDEISALHNSPYFSRAWARYYPKPSFLCNSAIN